MKEGATLVLSLPALNHIKEAVVRVSSVGICWGMEPSNGGDFVSPDLITLAY